MSHVAPISLKASTTIPAYYIVTAVTGTANSCKVAAAATDLPLGVSADTVLDTNLAIPVIFSGIAKVYFNDSCASGALVASNAAGQGVAHASASAGSYVIGTLIGPKVEATGTIANVLVNPFWIDLP
jgi:hypothetical protein